jgi:uncharacterized protein (TIGR03790 family)
MRMLVLLVFSSALWAVDPTRVLVLVNDNMPPESGTGGLNASLYVAQHYAAARGIPSANIFHVSTGTSQRIEYGTDYVPGIQTPLLAYLNANGGARKKQILCIVSTYGIPLYIGSTGTEFLAVDSMIAGIYLANGSPVSNPYFYPDDQLVPPYGTLWRPASPTPLTFEQFADQGDIAGNPRIYVTGRLDGLSAVASAALVDKAMVAEANISPTSGTMCWDWQGSRNPTEWQLWVDTRIRDGAELSHAKGYPTFLNRQASGDSISVFEPAPADVPRADGKVMSCPNALFGFGWSNYPFIPSPYTWANGALGSHEISCNGSDVRSKFVNGSCNWVAQMLQDDITGTWGTVDEPFASFYVQGINVFQFWTEGYTFGEAALLSSPVLRWTTYTVGDPLYQPKGIVQPPLRKARPGGGAVGR